MTDVVTRDVQAGAYRLRVHTSGSPDAPALVLLHGSGPGVSALSNWSHLLPRFAGTYYCVAPDVLGFGDSEHLAGQLGLVPQKAYLFSGTVASNLRYGKEDATDEELWEALRIAQADDFVRALAEGLEAPVAQGGTNFSGGQRQRLAIARAVVRRPSIYLFDDSFSALDLGTDARLRAALRPITRESTVLVVAQRVSTIVDADQILVLDDGRIVGLGTHDELVAGCPTYAEIVDSQLPAGAVA